MTKDEVVVVGYIMYHRLIDDRSFFNQIDNVIQIAKDFCKIYPEDFEWGVEIEFDETLEEYVKNYAR